MSAPDPAARRRPDLRRHRPGAVHHRRRDQRAPRRRPVDGRRSRPSTRAPTCSRQELERPFAERVLAPLGDRLVGIGRKLVRADTADEAPAPTRHRRQPARLGRQPAHRPQGARPGGPRRRSASSTCSATGIAVLPRSSSSPAALGAFGYVLPNILLYNAGQKREKLMRNALPDAIDLLTVSVEAGLGFDAAVEPRGARTPRARWPRSSPGCCRRCRSASAATDAMRAMAERTSLQDLKSFCLAMVQADSLGIPIGRVLRIQSQEMRTKRRQRAEEKAQQVPVRDHDPARALHPARACSSSSSARPASRSPTRSAARDAPMTPMASLDTARPSRARSPGAITTAVRVFALALATGTALARRHAGRVGAAARRAGADRRGRRRCSSG